MECPICLEVITNSCIGTCTHHFCYKCLINWCYRGGTRCPICKQYIYEIRMDKEFDFINNPEQYSIRSDYVKVINIKFNSKIKPGITLMNNNGPGVKIKKVQEDKQCYKSGLRNNDIILFLNNVPCTNHHDSIKFIEYAYKNTKILQIELLVSNNK